MRLIAILLITIVTTINAQNIKFSDNDDLIKVLKGDMVEIDTDTAFVISKTRAEFLNHKLDELNAVKELYNDLVDNRNELFKELENIEKLINKLSSKLENNSDELSHNLSSIMDKLDSSLDELKENNNDLKKHNSDLLSQIDQLENIVKDLKKETRGIWWNGITDKIVVFAGGAGIGILVAALL